MPLLHKSGGTIYMAEKLQIRELTVRDYRKIIKYLNKTGLYDRIVETMFPAKQDAVTGIETWGALRVAKELSAKQIEELQDKHTSVEQAVIAEYPELLEKHELKAVDKSPAEISREIVEIVYSVISDDALYNSSIELLADIYDVTTDDIEGLTKDELTGAVLSLASSKDFI